MDINPSRYKPPLGQMPLWWKVVASDNIFLGLLLALGCAVVSDRGV